ncbi:hypothetical protein [Martelella soudanensis]|uniref:hypothetical protein n=1 Tax=unclassified Martelella TaxID=2629616 RepID=UPI0015DE3226|nr:MULTISPECIES: hypothetical protein [unclassified Martelella]
MAAIPHRQTGVAAMQIGFVSYRPEHRRCILTLHQQLGDRRAGSSVCRGNKVLPL